MPIGASRVCAVLPGPIGFGGQVATCSDSGPDGRYALDVTPNRYTITATAEGFVPGSALAGKLITVLPEQSRSDVNIVLEPGGTRISGVVADATGGPVPHATVRAEHIDTRAATELEADDLGRFHLSFFPGPIVLVANAVGYAPARWTGRSPTANVRLVLTPGSIVRGTVVSAGNGEPVADIEVSAALARFRSPLPPSSVSGADGRFEIRDLTMGTYVLTAVGPHARGELPQPIDVGLGDTIENVRLEVRPATKVEGRVVHTGTGSPCEKGEVGLGVAPDLREPPVEGEAAIDFTHPPAGDGMSAPIEAGGIVRFLAVPAGRYHANVHCTDTIMRDGPRIVVVGTTDISDLTWKVGRGPKLTVLTVDERDQPVPGQTFYVQYPKWSERAPNANSAASTNEDGRYEFTGTLYRGTYELTVPPPVQADPVRVELGDDDGEVTTKIRIAGSATILATIRERAGDPVDGLRVSAHTDATIKADPAVVGPTEIAATPLGDGRYRITPLKPGRYEVEVTDGVNATVRSSYTVAGAQTIDATIELDRAGQVRGSVVDDGGNALPDVWVSAVATTDTGSSGRFGLLPVTPTRVLTDKDGRFVLDRLAGADATYSLRAEQPGGSAAVKKGVKSGDTDVAITLPSVGSIAGTVSGCNNSTQPVTVRAFNSETGQSTTRLVTNPAGSYVLSGVVPGHVQVVAFCSGQQPATTATELAPKQNVTGLQLVVQPQSPAPP